VRHGSYIHYNSVRHGLFKALRDWEYSSLHHMQARKYNLMKFFVEPYLPDYHNHPIIANSYEKEGMIGKLSNKMTSLLSLTVPNALNALFFKGESHPLTHLQVDAGFAHQDFIINANSTL
jgi:hypothetical protein